MEPFYFGSGAERRKLTSQRKLRKLYASIYTSIQDNDELRAILQTRWPLIVANAFKTSVISYRTALEFTPSPDGYIFLISKQSKTVDIGGINFKLIRGNPESDSNRRALMGALTASRERAFLELLISPRIQPADDRYLSLSVLEDRLEEMLKQSGEEELNRFRDRARKVSVELDLSQSFRKLNCIIGTLLGSRDIDLHGPGVRSRASGFPVDQKRMSLFLTLAQHLESLYYPGIQDIMIRNREYFENKVFFESYFSNYIEGTTFLIEEAEQIVFDKKNIEDRPEDSHDISGTFRIVSDISFMTEKISSADEFTEVLQRINRNIIPGRSDKKPGLFKDKANKAGNTIFVHPDYVPGTLREIFEISSSLSHPIGRAIFLCFAVSEIHPFNDGNGRTCRIILNRELLGSGYHSIIIPTVFREDYLLALRALSLKGRTAPTAAMFMKAQVFSRLDFSDYQQIKNDLIQRNWFLEPDEGRLIV